MSSDGLLARIRGEYREMPGLSLTLAQACRLWHVDVPTCEAVLQRLVSEHFLSQTHTGSFIALPMPRDICTPLKAMTAHPLPHYLPRDGSHG
jgi:hypothetical protein